MCAGSGSFSQWMSRWWNDERDDQPRRARRCRRRAAGAAPRGARRASPPRRARGGAAARSRRARNGLVLAVRRGCRWSRPACVGLGQRGRLVVRSLPVTESLNSRIRCRASGRSPGAASPRRAGGRRAGGSRISGGPIQPGIPSSVQRLRDRSGRKSTVRARRGLRRRLVGAAAAGLGYDGHHELAAKAACSLALHESQGAFRRPWPRSS